MSFELLGGAGTLYPLYSDLDSEAEPSPSPAPRQQEQAAPCSLTVNYPYMRRRNVPLSRKNSGTRARYNSRRDQVQIYRHNRPSYASYRHNRHSPKCHSLDTVSSISNLSVASTPRPFIASDGDRAYQSPPAHPIQQQFVYNNNVTNPNQSSNGQQPLCQQAVPPNITRTNDEKHTNTAKPNSATTCTNTAGRAHTQPQQPQQQQQAQQQPASKKGKRRRTRTFYSKKWGNRLYGLTLINYSMIASTPTPTPPPQRQTIPGPENAECQRGNLQTNSSAAANQHEHELHHHHFIHNHYNSQQLELWNKELQHAQAMRSASPPTYTEEEQFDINDIRSPRSVSPSATPMHLTVDFGLVPDHNDSCYDSAVSNVAANTDAEPDDDEDEDDDHHHNHHHHHHHEGLHAVQRKYFTHSQHENVDHNDDRSVAASASNRSGNRFKIVVSAPNVRDDEREQDEDHDERNAFKARMRARRARKRYFLRDSGMSDDCSSSDDAGDTTANEEEEDDEEDMDEDRHAMYSKHGLFLGGNDVHRGVYSQFSDISEESDTDYMSAQSDDFDELTICYRNNKNAKNIKFRDHEKSVHDEQSKEGNNSGNHNNDGCHLQVISTECNYLSELGQSDIGSSDTECYSSADSIPDSIPPPMDDDDADFLSDIQ